VNVKFENLSFLFVHMLELFKIKEIFIIQLVSYVLNVTHRSLVNHFIIKQNLMIDYPKRNFYVKIVILKMLKNVLNVKTKLLMVKQVCFTISLPFFFFKENKFFFQLVLKANNIIDHVLLVKIVKMKLVHHISLKPKMENIFVNIVHFNNSKMLNHDNK
jgi:hypothetical protein